MGLYLGIDAGGSTTRCVVGDARAELARVIGPSSKAARVGEAAARDAIREAIIRACREAAVDSKRIARTVVGISGGGRREVAAGVRRVVAEMVAGEVEVVGDMVIAHEGAFAGKPGVIVIAGTGSIAYGVNPEGIAARAGGWGPLLSDEGSGEWIGRAAARAVLRSLDEGQPAPLADLLAEAWGMSRGDFVSRISAVPPPDFSVLFPRVLQAAAEGDEPSAGLLAEAGRELARLAEIVLRKLWDPADPVRVAICGGVFENAAQVRDSFRERLRVERPRAVVGNPSADPLTGALLLARRGAGKAAPA